MLFRLAGSTLGVIVLLNPAHAQNEIDALRYSQTQSTGSSRTQALGGAGSTLGADLGAFVLNPANLGNYRRSEFSFSPGMLLNSSESTTRLGLTGSATSSFGDSRNVFNFANMGVVIMTKEPDETADWQSGAIGINFSRLATHSARRTYAIGIEDTARAGLRYFFSDWLIGDLNTNDPNYRDQVKQRAQGVVDNGNNNVLADFGDLGYNTYLLNFDVAGGRVQTGEVYIPSQFGVSRQEETTVMRGAQNQIDIGYGASYRGRLYVGGSLGILTLRYKQTRTLTETNDDPGSLLKSASLTDGYEVNGGGINLRIGMIWRPIDAIRVGGSIQTPSWFGELKEQGDQITLRTVFNRPPDTASSSRNFEASIAANTYQYSLTTPFRATGGLTLIGGKFGLVTGDVEYVNYGSARLHNANNEPDTFGETNNVIKNVYSSAVNYRVGVELRPMDVLRLRAGYGYYGSPYVDSNLKGDRTVISAGAGLRFERGYIDLGVSQTEFEQRYSPYTLANGREPVVTTKYKILNPTVTVGFILD